MGDGFWVWMMPPRLTLRFLLNSRTPDLRQ
jgi:hypothetical protein